jgi:hypothetical protein
MRKTRKTWLALLVLVGLLVIGSSLYAYGMRGSCHGTQQGCMGKTCDMSNVPNLTSGKCDSCHVIQQGCMGKTCDMSNNPNVTSEKCDSCQVYCDLHRVDSGKNCYGCH